MSRSSDSGYMAPVGFPGEFRMRRLGLRREGRLQLAGDEPEAGFQGGGQHHGHASQEAHQLGIGDPAGSGNEHLVPFFHDGQQGVEDAMLGASRDHDLRGRYSRPLSRRNFRLMASLRAGSPVTMEYLVSPARMLSTAFALACSGVSRSGSPAPRLSTSLPSALRRLYLESMATVWDGPMRRVREARGFTRPSFVRDAAFAKPCSRS